jgi:acyl-coenzyme A thioesterase PaaI-like protein
MKKLEVKKENDNCIGCGPNNPIGLKLEFITQNGKAKTESILDKNYEGYKNIIHGGIISLILDETSAKAVNSLGIVGVTGRIKVTFVKPLLVGKKFTCGAEVENIRGKLINTSSEIYSENELKARGEAIFMEVEKSDGE